MQSLLRTLCDRFPDITEKELFARIVCGEIVVDQETIRDPKRPVQPDAQVQWRSRRFVSRGGEKLQAALSIWSVPVHDLVFIDAGASTGGFTDCLLQSGARLVHAVDVGYNQLDYRLRRDPRVVVHERTNLMAVHNLDPKPDAGVADLSFRSLRKAAAHLLELTIRRWAVVLVKPQFEVAASTDAGHRYGTERGRAVNDLGFDGVVRDRAVLLESLLSVRDQLQTENVAVVRTLASPRPGRRGNREFLFLIAGMAEAGRPAFAAGPDCKPQAVEAELRRQVAELPVHW
jgi:23S rRNA (cytidine1920-2'-O)/16S rRNA (cytidine1409-2'-O)-methyltransferase